MMGKGWHPWTTGTSNQPLPSLSSNTNLLPFLSSQPPSKRYWRENSSVLLPPVSLGLCWDKQEEEKLR